MEILRTDTSTSYDKKNQGKGVSAVSLKGSVFTLPILKMNVSDIDAIEHDLQSQLAAAPGFFKDSPVVLDMFSVTNDTIEFQSLKSMLMKYNLIAVGVQNASVDLQAEAIKHGLGIIPVRKSVTIRPVETKTAPIAESNDEDVEDLTDVSDSAQFSGVGAMINNQPVRSGQRVYARGCDLIQLAAVNAGAEIIADGNIHVYAPLRGRALAGVNGNEQARIFCHSFAAELIAVAGNYRVFEDNIPPELYKQSVQIFLQEEQLIIRSIS